MMQILHGDCLAMLKTLPDESVNCCVTSPPYFGLRDYQVDGQIGLEATPELYTAKLVTVFREVRRVLKNDGVHWLNLGDSYYGSCGNYSGENRGKGKQRTITNGRAAPNPAYDGLEDFRPPTTFKHASLKPKDLIGIPWMVAFALRADGWYLRSDIIWSKPNPMPESVTDRPTKAHEYIFLMSKSERYWYDHEAIKDLAVGPAKVCGPKNDASRNDGDRTGIVRGDGLFRNRRSVWEVSTQPYPDAHFATFPPKLIEPCILAGCPAGGIVLDPFMGSGTTLYVAKELNRDGIGIELNAEYIKLAEKRLAQEVLPL